MSLYFRDLSIANLPEMQDVWVASWQQAMPEIDFEARRVWLAEHLTKLFADGHRVRGAYRGQTAELSGFVSIDPVSQYLDQLVVSSAAKGRGVAEALLNDARQLSPGGIKLQVNQDNFRAIAFYKKHGFFADGEEGVSILSGKPFIVMRWVA